MASGPEPSIIEAATRTDPTGKPHAVAALRRAAVRATLAPSIRNTQPWRLVLRGTALEVHADWERRLRALDRRGQQLLVSCGAAALNARASLAASGYDAVVERFPEPALPDLVVRITVTDIATRPLPLGDLDAVIELRHTNRRPFFDEPVPEHLVDVLVAAARTEGAELATVRLPEQQRTIRRLTAEADALERLDPACRADLRASANADSRHRGTVAGGSRRVTEMPRIDTRGEAWLTPGSGGTDQCLMVLGCAQDTPLCWLRTGEALEHLLLEITRRGWVANPLTQALEVASTSDLLRRELGLTMYPQVVLRVGRAPSSPASRRRRLVDVFEDLAG